ncbi:uncharacterized protein TRIREDRAFT_120980 [Trichoderma reesei QM6a]|uniref:Predicted protein n=1 Tax=Hypocrea jecorina (strain QM6a) TaxID=431241 RepID=G0REV1_HYPJQ|nr:uncharacterized protein TRIREDRAFT_120980 [Trichoderma reesei QM6a]EGR50186.1 predicted protein [Trichoderma reesei QM6a]
MIPKTTLALLFAALAAAGPIQRREVASLNPDATAEAQKRDDTATRAFSNVQIKTSDGKCLSVDPLSGDFRANLTPIQITDCGSAQGQGWDVITAGVHNDQKGQALIVSTLTQACFNFDPRRAAGNQVLLFSCGGRADGGGQVTNSQLFAFTGGAGPLSLTPGNDPTKCFAAKGNVVDIADCNDNDASQKFTFGDAAAGGSDNGNNNDNNDNNDTSSSSATAAASSVPAATQAPATSAAAAPSATPSAAAPADDQNSLCSAPKVITVTDVTTVTAGAAPPAVTNEATQTAESTESAAAAATSSAGNGSQTTAAASQPAVTANPTTPVPVSGAGGTLNPTAVAEAQKFDASAVRPLESVNIRAADGRCFFIDPTAGDFRENLIPVGLAECSEDASQKFDIVTKGVHNDGQAGEALIVSVLTNGCLNFDGRRAANDQVILFSCGGRADGDGQTATSQLFPFEAGSDTILLTPNSADKQTCLIAGADRVEAAQCSGQKDQTFELVEVL